ncbi:MAG TPA: hypothetical protein VGH91_00720 [Gammaproteobacteria bacterium]|jgi:hypothetical protein
MSIHRMFNSLWAVITTGGMVQKIATNPYNPSPGSSSSSANNQALAKVNGTSPFITIDGNGLAVNATGGAASNAGVSTSLSSFNSSAGTALDENSGKYQVVRQYGDIYMFNDGNIISWGGNGKNFSFGNGYEESHAWASGPYVYNKETFTFPKGAFSPYLVQTTPVPSTVSMPASIDDYEWLGGNVSKSWGVDYSYTYGFSYEWSSGPKNYIDAYGNTGDAMADVMQGKHCTFSYGTGYEESLIEWTSTSTYFHADDKTSPYKSRVSDSWTTSNLGSSWTAGNLLVSKAFGPTYDYHYGPALSIQEGASEEHVNGASWSTVAGDSNETVNGNSTSNVTGNSNETVTGNQTSMVKGNSTEQHWGGAAEFFMGGKSEMILAACDEITLSVKVEMKTLGAVEIFGGASLAIYLGLLVEAQAGTKIEISQLKVKAHEAKVTATTTASVQANGAATIAASPINLTTP